MRPAMGRPDVDFNQDYFADVLTPARFSIDFEGRRVRVYKRRCPGGKVSYFFFDILTDL